MRFIVFGVYQVGIPEGSPAAGSPVRTPNDELRWGFSEREGIFHSLERAIQRDSLARPRLDSHAPSAVANLARSTQTRPDERALEGASSPDQIDLEAAARAQARHCAIGPCPRKGRQQIEASGMALEEHLCDPRCRA